jgi:ABC-type transporter Mla MlaB component
MIRRLPQITKPQCHSPKLRRNYRIHRDLCRPDVQRAQLIILDIAGVSVVDTSVAQALLHTAHALRLLGCTVFLSGIAAEVATTLVQLGIGLEGIMPVRNPQYALTRFGKINRQALPSGVDADAGAMV